MDVFRVRLSTLPQLHSYLLYLLYKTYHLNPHLASRAKLFGQVTSFLALHFVTVIVQSRGSLLCRGHLRVCQIICYSSDSSLLKLTFFLLCFTVSWATKGERMWFTNHTRD